MITYIHISFKGDFITFLKTLPFIKICQSRITFNLIPFLIVRKRLVLIPILRKIFLSDSFVFNFNCAPILHFDNICFHKFKVFYFRTCFNRVSGKINLFSPINEINHKKNTCQCQKRNKEKFECGFWFHVIVFDSNMCNNLLYHNHQ